MSCSTGIHKVIETVLDNKPWFKYKKGDSFIEILENVTPKINKNNSIGVANKVADTINSLVNKFYPNVGNIFYAQFYDDKSIVRIFTSNKQLDYINAEDVKETQRLMGLLIKANQEKEYRDRQTEGNWEEIDGEIVQLENNTLKLEEAIRSLPKNECNNGL